MDLDGDAIPELLSSGAALFLHSRQANGQYISRTVNINADVSEVLGFGDWDGDGDMDPVLRYLADSDSLTKLGWVENQGGDLASSINRIADAFMYAIVDAKAADFDLDGDSDLLLLGGEGLNQAILIENQGSVVSRSPEPATPVRTGLLSAYPNPMRSQAMVSYSLGTAGDVRLELFDLLGRRVQVLEFGWRAPGHHTSPISTANLPSGTYRLALASFDGAASLTILVVH
jgi:hypothetical protein